VTGGAGAAHEAHGMSGEHGGLATKSFVDVHAIEDELAKVRWRLRPDGVVDEAAEHAAAEARASVLNLITVVSTEERLRWATGVLGGLSRHHPSRTIILLSQEDRSEAKLEASVSARTRTDGGHRVTTEQVLLHAHGRIAEHLASLVVPLVVPDLPVMLWWPGRPDFESRLFNELVDLCDRLVVDTDDEFEEQDFRKLLDVSRSAGPSCSIGDFNWARLMPWRHLMAQFFEPPQTRMRLLQLEGVAVWYGAEGSDAQARLLAGWVKSRLRPLGIEVPADLLEDPELPHGVSRFMLYTGGEDGRARFSVVRERGGRLIAQVRIGDQEQPGRTVRPAQRKPEDLLALEMTLPGHDIIYEEALAAAIDGI
jgi:glucose-6-phosphate dehydrogenase assembly protein OpcA